MFKDDMFDQTAEQYMSFLKTEGGFSLSRNFYV